MMIVMKHSRREFLSSSGLAAGGLFGSAWLKPAFAFARSEPDLVLLNGNIHTMDPARPTASAFAVLRGRFVGIGTNEEMRALAGKGTRIIDAGNCTVLPGFIDCHLHPDGETLLYETLVGNPFEVEHVTIASVIDKLRHRAAETPPGVWVSGYFFDDTKLKDRRGLTRQDLDKVSTTHPVVVYHRGGHSGFFNSRAFELAGITRDTPNPPGGTYDRNAAGELTGRVTDSAMAPFDKVGERQQFSAAEVAERTRAGLHHMSTQFVRYGLTTVHHSGGDLSALQELRAAGKLLHRVNYELTADVLEPLMKAGVATGFGDEWLRIGATFEHFSDGSFSERTMALSRPYPGSNPPYSGNIAETQDRLNDWAERMYRAGIQPNMHANGDVGIGMALTAYEHAQARVPRKDMRPKITHCTYVNADLVRRIKALGAVPAPFTTYLYYNSDKFAFYGEEMLRSCLAFRSFLDAGIPVAAGSDFSPGPFSPLMGIQGMVTRTGWDGKTWGANQRISVAEALKIYTLHGAYASHEEQIKGSISLGKFADFVFLSEDPHRVPPDKIKDIRVVETFTGGNSVYQA